MFHFYTLYDDVEVLSFKVINLILFLNLNSPKEELTFLHGIAIMQSLILLAILKQFSQSREIKLFTHYEHSKTTLTIFKFMQDIRIQA